MEASPIKLNLGEYIDARTGRRSIGVEVINATNKSLSDIKVEFEYEYESVQDRSTEFGGIAFMESGRRFSFVPYDGSGPLPPKARRNFAYPADLMPALKSLMASLSPERFRVVVWANGSEQLAISGTDLAGFVKQTFELTASLTVDYLLASSNVIDAFRCAYLESGVGTDSPVEQGGFILRKPNSSELDVVRVSPGRHNSLNYPLCPDGTYEGRRIVGTFHTHPNTGPGWRQEPSLQDVNLSRNYPETMGAHQFVIARDTIYHVDNDGIVSEVGRTRAILGLDEEPTT